MTRRVLEQVPLATGRASPIRTPRLISLSASPNRVAAALAFLSRMGNKSFWCWSKIAERVTGHECQFWTSLPLEDLHVVWIDDLNCIYDISKCSVGCHHNNAVLRSDLTQGPEECVAMSGDSDVSLSSWQSSAFDVSRGHSKYFLRRAFEHHHRKVKPGNLDSADRLAKPRRNDYESSENRSGMERFRSAGLLVIEDLPRRSLRAEHVKLEIPIPGKSECAPDDEDAPEIDHQLLAHR